MSRPNRKFRFEPRGTELAGVAETGPGREDDAAGSRRADGSDRAPGAETAAADEETGGCRGSASVAGTGLQPQASRICTSALFNLSRMRWCRPLVALADVIAVPIGNMDRYIAFHYRLATQSGVQLEVGRLFHAIHLVVVHFGEVVHSLLHNYVARSAGAASPAGVFQMESVVHRDIEQRFRTPVILIGQLAGLELENFSRGEKSNLGHFPIVAVRI